MQDVIFLPDSGPVGEDAEFLLPGGGTVTTGKYNKAVGCAILVGALTGCAATYVACTQQVKSSPPASSRALIDEAGNTTASTKKELVDIAPSATESATQEGPLKDRLEAAGKANEAHQHAANKSKRPVGGDGWALLQDGTACRNGNEMRLGPVTKEGSVGACAKRCHETAGCRGFAYQSQASPSRGSCAHEHAHAPWLGACQLWNGTCEVANDLCYDAYTNSKSSDHAWSLRKANTRCEDWEFVGLANLTVVADETDCAALCLKTGGCEGFAFKRGNERVFGGYSQGACYLRGGDCATVGDDDWDDYQLASPIADKSLWMLNQRGQGCKNWKAITLYAAEDAASPAVCGARCFSAHGCVGFGFNPTEKKCVHWGGACEASEDPDWDDYSLIAI